MKYNDEVNGHDVIRINKSDEIESIMISLIDYPNAFNAKVEELMEQGMTQADALEFASQPIELELYYHKHSGLFGLESGAVESCDMACSGLFSPYDTNVELMGDNNPTFMLSNIVWDCDDKDCNLPEEIKYSLPYTEWVDDCDEDINIAGELIIEKLSNEYGNTIESYVIDHIQE